MKNIFLYLLLLSSTIQAQEWEGKKFDTVSQKDFDWWLKNSVRDTTFYWLRLAGQQRAFVDSILGKYQDTAYWNHITKHERFKFIKSDTTVTGRVIKIFTERDGDLHVILKQKRKILRCEIICYQRVNEACNGFWNHTKRPKIGSIVTVYGDYVYDRWHHWHEIHPVKKIESR